MPWPRLRGGRDAATLEAALAALDHGDASLALRTVERVLRSGAAGGPGDDSHVAALVLRSDALFELERFQEALKAAAAACAEDPEEPDAWSAAGAAAYRVGNFDGAAGHLRRLTELAPRDAGGWHSLGRALLWTGDEPAAAVAFRRAAGLDPSHHVVPVRIAEGEFDRIAAEVWRTIPGPFAARLANTMAVAELLPDAEEVEEGLDPDVLGIYDGGTALEDGGMFERVVLYQRNHENVCATVRELREEVRRTVLHEVGHHFGMDEHDLPY